MWALALRLDRPPRNLAPSPLERSSRPDIQDTVVVSLLSDLSDPFCSDRLLAYSFLKQSKSLAALPDSSVSQFLSRFHHDFSILPSLPTVDPTASARYNHVGGNLPEESIKHAALCHLAGETGSIG